MSMDQIEGLEPIHENWGDVNLGEELDEGGDPPRIWSPFGEYPGTAFTRSMGDVIAEDLGVFAEPEIIHRKVHPHDKFVVIASDGVFEFLTNQSVADMVNRYADPLDACKKVVQEAYDLWLQYEVRTDDITIICIFLDGVTEEPAATNLDSVALEGLRPVRREMSRQRHRQFIVSTHESFMASPTSSPRNGSGGGGGGFDGSGYSFGGGGRASSMMGGFGGGGGTGALLMDDAYSIEDNVSPKTEVERASILHAIASNFLFDHIPEAQRRVLLDVIRKVPVKAGDWVIRQGDPGDKFYIIDSGRFDVVVSEDGGDSGGGGEVAAVAANPARGGGVVVHTYEPTDTIKPCFGHLALLYSKPRSASVVARTDGVLWALDRPVFRRIIMRKSRREVVRTLRCVDVLRSLSLQQIQQLCDCLTEASFEPGQAIIRQGEVGDTFYVMEEGTAIVTMTTKDGAAAAAAGESGGATEESGGAAAEATGAAVGAEGAARGAGDRAAISAGEPTEKVIRRLRPYDYFGERSLLLKEPRSANVVAERRVRCLMISQKGFEDVLGPLQHIIDEDRKRRESRPGVPALADLRILGVVSRDDLGQMNLCKLPHGSATYTLRTMWKADIAAMRQRSTVLKAADILKHVAEHPVVRMGCVSVPGLLGTYNAERALHVLQPVAVACSLATLLEERRALSMDAARHVAACLLLGLEALHKANVLYRALSPELVQLDGRGYAVLMEFRLARLGLDGAQTLCGTPEYLAPEQVRHQGHGKAVDFWALGVLIYELMSGASPFAAAAEMDVYHKITTLKAGKMSYPTAFAPALCDFLDRLLNPDPAERLGARAADMARIKTHQWFASFDWGGVSKGECFQAELRQAAHDKIQKAVRSEAALPVKDKPFSGSDSAFDRF
ncbi:unnamed protein product [Phaeothamnion confervicola]